MNVDGFLRLGRTITSAIGDHHGFDDYDGFLYLKIDLNEKAMEHRGSSNSLIAGDLFRTLRLIRPQASNDLRANRLAKLLVAAAEIYGRI